VVNCHVITISYIIINSGADAFSVKIKIDGKFFQKIQIILQCDKHKDSLFQVTKLMHASFIL